MKQTSKIEKILNGTYNKTNNILLSIGSLAVGVGIFSYATTYATQNEFRSAILGGTCALMVSYLSAFGKKD